MTSLESEFLLPRVEEADLLLLVADDLLDPTHRQRWEAMAHQNPVLAREILKRAYYKTAEFGSGNPYEIQKSMIDLVSFALHALEIAVRRQNKFSVPTVDDDVEYQLPSA